MNDRLRRGGLQRVKMFLVVGVCVMGAIPGLGQVQGAPHVDSATVHARGDIGGDWQGTISFPGNGGQGGAKFRLVLRVSKGADGSWSALNYSIDQGPTPMQTSAVSLQGSTFRFAIASLGGSYAGQVSADGNAITGTWTQGSALPLNFVRATKETAWEIPAPAPKVVAMAADADPTFEVATIKPTAPEASEKYFRVYGRRFLTQDTSLAELMEVAYGVHGTQIVGAPAWVSEEKFDVAATPDGVGEPSGGQWTNMLRKLLEERFQLVVHREKKELSAYVISVGKGGAKNFRKSESTYPLPSLEFNAGKGGVMLPARNATLGQFASMLQAVVLDRPVVDQTGMVGKFDFELTFLPDDSEFGGRPPRVVATDDPAPGLSEALSQQLGLRLATEKIAVDVVVVDRVERPSAN